MSAFIYGTLIVLLGLPLAIYMVLTRWNSYWKRKNVPYIRGEPFWGNMRKSFLLKENVALELSKFYFDEKTKNSPYVGFTCFHKPLLMIKEPELIKQILIKDFNYFYDRHSTSSPHTDNLSYYNLFFVKNPIWRELRTRLTPVFTSGKMKLLFYVVDEIGNNLNGYLKSLIISEKKKYCNLDIKDLCGKYTSDSIAASAFGIQANTISDPNSEFRMYGKDLFRFTWYRGFELMSFFFMPELVRWCNFKIFNDKLANVIRTSIKYSMDMREKAGVAKNDFIDALITLKNEDKDKISDKINTVFKGDMIYAQAAVFFAAGFETSSSTMAFTLYEITMQVDIQERLRKDIKNMLEKNNNKLNYDDINNLQYLDMIIKETLRMYPPLPFLDRICSADKEGYSLKPFGDFKIPNGMGVFIPFYSLHNDPKYFPNPEKYDPERFAPENIDAINPYVYMPFGRGPRNCIGDRFGLMQTKIGLVSILRDFYAKPAANTLKPMKLQKEASLLQAEGGIFLDLVQDPLIT